MNMKDIERQFLEGCTKWISSSLEVQLFIRNLNKEQREQLCQILADCYKSAYITAFESIVNLPRPKSISTP